MKTLSILITLFAFLAFYSNVKAQEPVKDKTKTTEVKKEGNKETKSNTPSEKKTDVKDKKGNNKSSSTGEPIPGSEILLEQEPDNKVAPKDNGNHEDDMMLEDDK